ncbi:MAG: hypothetical protein ACR2KQ_02925 [Actinomycetota bacterium]
MSRTWGPLAWGLFFVALGCSVVGWMLGSFGRVEVADLAPFTLSWSFPLVGALISSRQPRNTIGWLFIAIGVVVASQGLMNTGSTVALENDNTGLAVRLAYWYAAWAWLPPLVLIAPFTFLLFPNGRLPGPRWRAIAWAGGIGAGLVVAAQALMPWDDAGEFGNAVEAGVTNPFGLAGRAEQLEIPLILGGILLLVALPGGVAASIVRFKRSRGVERQQLKWMTFAIVLAAGAYFITNIVELVQGDAVLALTLPLIPASAGYAILRHRLYDIDVIINRALVYGALTVLLAGLYLLSVLGLQQISAPVTADSDIAVAASTLAVAALFRPLRSKVQRFIDRRFYRHKYDAATTVATFADRVRDEVDLGELSRYLVQTTRSTVQPAHVSLWIKAVGR